MLVAVFAQCIVNRSFEVVFENASSSKLANFLRRLADCQVASARLAVLNLAISSDSHPFFGRFVGFLLCHNSMIFRIFEGEEFNDRRKFIQG
jgi:hypothetical protein